LGSGAGGNGEDRDGGSSCSAAVPVPADGGGGGGHKSDARFPLLNIVGYCGGRVQGSGYWVQGSGYKDVFRAQGAGNRLQG